MPPGPVLLPQSSRPPVTKLLLMVYGPVYVLRELFLDLFDFASYLRSELLLQVFDLCKRGGMGSAVPGHISLAQNPEFLPGKG